MTDHDDTLYINNQFKDADEISIIIPIPEDDTLRTVFESGNYAETADVLEEMATKEISVVAADALREAICMHCAQTITITHSNGTYQFVHPKHSADPHTSRWTMNIGDNTPQEDLLIALGSFIRNTVHEEEQMHRPEDRLEEQTEPKKIEVKAPHVGEFTHIQHHPHLQAIINEVLGPHVHAIASVLHMTDIIGAGQEMVISMTDECGFDGDIIIRVRSMGDDAQH